MVRKQTSSIPIAHRVVLFERLYADLKANPYGQSQEVSLTLEVFSDQTKVTTNLGDEHVWESFLLRFRQLISPKDPVYIDTMLRLLPPHVADEGLRLRLAKARTAWKAARGVQSQFAPLVLGKFAANEDLARLYLYGGVVHHDPELSDIWSSMSANDHQFIMYEFRRFEVKVRDVVVELKKVIDEARERGLLTDEPVDLGPRPA